MRIIMSYFTRNLILCVKCWYCINMVSIIDVLTAISDDKSLLLLQTTARSNSETTSSDILIRLNLTRRQYYTRMSELVKANLVFRRNGKYYLSSLGKIVYDAQTVIEEAISDFWKLKAIDALQNSDQLPKEEYNNIIGALIDNEKVKERLLIDIHASTTEELPQIVP
jgi:predicted transcriptional regulator